jgi:hypothetical protein
MSRGHFSFNERSARDVVTKTATCTLDAAELDFTLIKASGGAALTLPVPTADMEKFHAKIINAGSGSVTVVVAAGYGGNASSNTTVTLAQGQMCEVMCDGDYWYVDRTAA